MNLLQEFAKWYSEHQLPCFWKHYFDIDCPFCGFQRSVIALLQGDIWKSITLFPALLPLLATGSLFLVHLFFPMEKLKKTLNILLLTDLLIMVGNCILKNILHFAS